MAFFVLLWMHVQTVVYNVPSYYNVWNMTIKMIPETVFYVQPKSMNMLYMNTLFFMLALIMMFAVIHHDLSLIFCIHCDYYISRILLFTNDMYNL